MRRTAHRLSATVGGKPDRIERRPDPRRRARAAIAAVAVGVSMLFGAGGGTAQSPPAAAPTADRPRIAIATPTDWPPYSDAAMPGGGLLAETVAAAFSAAGYAPTLVHLPIAGARDAALDGTFAGWIGAPDAAADRFLLSDPLIAIEPVLITHADMALDWTGVGRLRGLTLCAPEGYAVPPSVAAAVAAGGIDRLAPATLAGCARAIADNPDLFAVVDPRRMAEALRDAGLSLHAVHFSPMPVASLSLSLGVAAVRSDAARLVEDFHQGLAALRESGLLAEIRSRAWTAAPIDPAAPRLLLWGQSEAGFPPYTLRFGANTGGYIPRLLEELGRRTGHRFLPRYLPASRGWQLYGEGLLDAAVPVDPNWFGPQGPPGHLSRPLGDTRDRLILSQEAAAAIGPLDAIDPLALLSTAPVATVTGYRFAYDDRLIRIDRPNEAAVLEIVARGRTAFGILEERVYRWLLEHHIVGVAQDRPPTLGPALSEGTFHLLLNDRHGDIVADIDAALRTMADDGTLDAIRSRWLRPLLPLP